MHSRSWRFVSGCGIVIALLLLALPVAAQQVPPTLQQCRDLANLGLPQTTIVAAEVVASNSFVAPGADDPMQLPGFCRVRAVSEPAVQFEVWLPLLNWNGKFQVVGNGGMAGTISYGAMGNALSRGYATASTCLLYTSPSPRDRTRSRMPSSA